MIVRKGQIWRKASDVHEDSNLRDVDFTTDYEVADNSIDLGVLMWALNGKEAKRYSLEYIEDNFIYITTLPKEQKPKNKYHRNLKGVTVDVYDVLKAFEVTDPALQHLIKKALCAGLRGHKNKDQDLQDILESAKRAVELNSL